MYKVINKTTNETVKEFREVEQAWNYIYDNYLAYSHTVKFAWW